MMGLIQKQRMGMTFLLLIAVVLVGAPAYVSAQSAIPCKGTWDGTFEPGTGTVSVFYANHKINTSSIMSGTFSGDTTHGNWGGNLSTNYTVPDMSTKGQVSSTIAGNYVMTIGPSGAVSGTANIPLTGGFSGQITLAFQGQQSQTGGLSGTWTGTLTVTQVTYSGLPLSANITAPGSGQFTGTAQSAVPEFGGVTVVLFSALMASVYLLKRRHEWATSKLWR